MQRFGFQPGKPPAPVAPAAPEAQASATPNIDAAMQIAMMKASTAALRGAIEAAVELRRASK